jgi:outer membrane protein OmpA-like peptidoglycan-associated protein
MLHTKHWYVIAALAVAGGATRADAQGFGDRLRRAAAEAAQRKVERRVEDKTEAATDATLARAEKGARAAAKGAAEGAAQGASAPAPTNVGKDFVPGTRVLFATDFARDEIGDFPRAFTLKGGNAEVADVGGTRYLRATSIGKFEVPLPEVLPERFTIEFDLKRVAGWGQYLYFTDEEDSRAHLSFGVDGGGIEGPNGYRVYSSLTQPGDAERVARVQVMADGQYVKVYMNGQRVANAPNADIGRARKLIFMVKADEEHPALIGNLRVAAGGKDLYKALAGAGRVTAEGVLFDTNSDRLRAESAPVLKEIADMLAAHPELRLSIEGHTDDVGRAADNQALSAKRAAAVRAYLVAQHGVAADRLTAQGFGATKPVAGNTDEAGRQKNRRVELVKR